MLEQTIGNYFLQKMESGEVHFAYRTKNGELRIARGTLKPSLIPESARPELADGFNPLSCNHTSYWDLDSEGWRSFDENLVVWAFDLYSPNIKHSEWEAIQEYKKTL